MLVILSTFIFQPDTQIIRARSEELARSVTSDSGHSMLFGVYNYMPTSMAPFMLIFAPAGDIEELARLTSNEIDYLEQTGKVSSVLLDAQEKHNNDYRHWDETPLSVIVPSYSGFIADTSEDYSVLHSFFMDISTATEEEKPAIQDTYSFIKNTGLATQENLSKVLDTLVVLGAITMVVHSLALSAVLDMIMNQKKKRLAQKEANEAKQGVAIGS